MDLTLVFETAFKLPVTDLQVYQHPQNMPISAWKYGAILGQGLGSKVYEIDAHGRTFALRITKGDHQDRDTDNSVQHILASFYLAPKIFYAGKTPEFRFTIMDKIYGTLTHIIQKEPQLVPDVARAFPCLLDKKYVLRFLHGDMHTDNVVLLGDGKTLGLIDFDFSFFRVTHYVSLTDFVPLVGSLKPISPNLVQHVCEYYKDRYNLVIQPEKIRVEQRDGYQYVDRRLKINSYFLIGNTHAENIKTIFPDIKLPRIIPPAPDQASLEQ